ncbi:hypothetical protein A4D02_22230 [Niastella koreensis]|uniref:4-O-methyl-glucuronoyl methylesterase-like domain-containing protein n=2 Tax=Niastella koreensis TaxID=354356 RepID=G8TFK1_NIAKG|nr:hypothetical protein [Niastella koreensis]AEV98432.1 hypothetical protein Niako_2077 [Niastella koreensis GR20-10]OQP53120.1 hypothetical protein A4D02_22230 [Niastella koreensis]
MKNNRTCKLAVLLFVVTAMTARAQNFPSNTDESKVPPYTLPDVLQMPIGKTVINSNQWLHAQRPYIYHLYEKNQFGRYPATKTISRFKILETDNQALDGLATRKQVRIYLHPADTSVYMDVLLYLPNAVKTPAPVFVAYNFSGNHTITAEKNVLLSNRWMYFRGKGVVNNRATEAARGTDTASWQLKTILSKGFALATAYYGDLEPDTATGYTTGIRTTLKEVLNIQPDEWCTMGAWAWGLSRIADYLQTDKNIDAGKIALMGHSRLGKATLWAGASDPRFALIVSNESGEGGAALSRRWYGETVQIITAHFPHWFVAKYKTYGDDVTKLPVDGHMLLSLMAPRPLYVASAVEDTWSDPKGEFLSAREASRVYALFGKKGIDTSSMPPLNTPVGETVRYHIRSGKHAVTLYDWEQYLKFASEQFGLRR